MAHDSRRPRVSGTPSKTPKGGSRHGTDNAERADHDQLSPHLGPDVRRFVDRHSFNGAEALHDLSKPRRPTAIPFAAGDRRHGKSHVMDLSGRDALCKDSTQTAHDAIRGQDLAEGGGCVDSVLQGNHNGGLAHEIRGQLSCLPNVLGLACQKEHVGGRRLGPRLDHLRHGQFEIASRTDQAQPSGTEAAPHCPDAGRRIRRSPPGPSFPRNTRRRHLLLRTRSSSNTLWRRSRKRFLGSMEPLSDVRRPASHGSRLMASKPRVRSWPRL